MLSAGEVVESVSADLSARYARDGFPGFGEAGAEAGDLARAALGSAFAEPGCPESFVRCGATGCCVAAGAFRPMLDAAGGGSDERRSFCYRLAVAIDRSEHSDFSFVGRCETAMRSLGCSLNSY